MSQALGLHTNNANNTAPASTRPGETAIFYYCDDDDKPYLCSLKIPIEQVTLADFKETIQRPQTYRYYLKAFDDIIGIYKKEISSDEARLEPFKGSGRIVVWLKSQVTSAGAGGNVRSDAESDSNRSSKALLPPSSRRSFDAPLRNARDFSTKEHHHQYHPSGGVRDGGSASVASGRPSEQTNRGFETDSMVSFGGPSHQHGKGASYSDSEFDGSSRASSMAPGDTASLSRNERSRRRKLTKQRPNLVRASSASSVTDTVCSGNHEMIIVRFNREHGGTLGIRPVERDGQIFVESILMGCAVDLDKRIQVGDIILQVNNQHLSGMRTDEATAFLRQLTKKPGPISLKIVKTEQETSYGAGSGNAAGLRRAQVSSADVLPFPYQEEDTLPINLETWLAHTEMLRPMASIAPTSLYDAESIIQPRYGLTDRGTPLSADHSDMLKVVRRMAQRHSGLEVKDRMWLKIEIKDAFMGRNLVKWLKENVEGIEGVKDGKRYALQLLNAGYILPSMGTTDFSEKAYYTFDAAILEEHQSSQDTYQSINGSLVNHDDMDDIPDSVSQIAHNPFPYASGQTFSFPPLGSAPASRRANGASHSSGGSGHSSERRLRSIYEEGAALHNSSAHLTGRAPLTGTPHEGPPSRSSFKMAMGKY